MANWNKTTVSQGTGAAVDPTSVEYMALSLEFTAAGQPRVAGHTVELPRQGPTVSSTVYVQCDSACSAPEPSPPPNPNWTVTRLAARQGIALMLGLDDNDAPDILVAGEEDLRGNLRWLRCTAGCTAAANWTNTLMGIEGSDPELVFGTDNRPQVTFKGPVGSPKLAYGQCLDACDTASPSWDFQEAGNAAAYEASLPLPGSACHPGAWLVGLSPLYGPRPERQSPGELSPPITCTRPARQLVDQRLRRAPRPLPHAGTVGGHAAGRLRRRRRHRPLGVPQRGVVRRGQATAFLGTATDIPVPGDYDGNAATDRAVYRDGTWFTEGQPNAFLGLSSDIPAPGDYNGDGRAERAVYRPSVGAWYIEDQPPVFFGNSSDIPVPGDYDGNGTTDIAVFRPSVDGWYVNGQPTAFSGLSGDIPVPGDYDGNGTTDKAVFRPSVGGWYIAGQTTVFTGLSGDVPVPGDYDKDGDTDRAIWRKAVGGWYTSGQATVFLGLSGDVPLPLPQAIYRMFFVP